MSAIMANRHALRVITPDYFYISLLIVFVSFIVHNVEEAKLIDALAGADDP